MQQPHQTTLTDVARLAGVSRCAAGKILNGGAASIRVGAEARERILAASRELDYQPNLAASLLRGGQSHLLGVIMDSGSHYRYLQIFQELEQLCSVRGYRIITSFTHDNFGDMQENYRMMLRYGVCGVICLSHDYSQFKEDLIRLFSGVKNVVFMEQPFCSNWPHVTTSRTAAFTAMLQDAQSRGIRRPCLLCASRIWHTEDLLAREFLQAAGNCGIPAEDRLILEYPRQQSEKFDMSKRMRWVIAKLQKLRPDFIFLDDATHAAALKLSSLEAGLDIPLYGGNNNPLFTALGIPSLDPCYRKTAEALFAQILHPSATTPVIEAIYQ